MADGLHGDVGLGQFHFKPQQAEGGNGHKHQDQSGDQGPGDFEACVMGELGGDGMRLLVETHHHVNQQAQHKQ